MLLASPPASPTALRASIVAAGKSQHSVHYVSASTTSTGGVTIVADAGVSQGIQHITYRKGKQTGHVTVIVTGRTAYLRGDAFTLTNFIGIKAAGAQKYANTWILVPFSHPAYAPIAAAVTLASAIDELGAKSGTLTRAKGRIGGRNVVGVRSVVKTSSGTVTDTVYGLDSTVRLPVQETVVRTGLHATNTFSKWNERVTVSKPSKTVSIAKVLAASAGPAA